MWMWQKSDAWACLDLCVYYISGGNPTPWIAVQRALLSERGIFVNRQRIARLWRDFDLRCTVPQLGSRKNGRPYQRAGFCGQVRQCDYELIRTLFSADPSMFLKEAQLAVKAETGRKYHAKALRAALYKMGYSLKVLEHRAKRMDEEAREQWRALMASGFATAVQMLVLDETHLSRHDCRRRRGRAPRGKPAVARDFIGGPAYNLSVMACCTVDGFVIEGTKVIDHNTHPSGEAVTDTAAMVEWAQSLCDKGIVQPYPLPRSVIVLDGASVHHNTAVIDTFEAAGACVLILPPYRCVCSCAEHRVPSMSLLTPPTNSPDLSPIESMFSQFKNHLRAIGAQIAPARFIDEAMSVVTPRHAAGHFRHCGYPVVGGASSSSDSEEDDIALACFVLSYT
jgi:hypothetical protein